MAKKSSYNKNKVKKVLKDAVELAKKNKEGAVASYIPELASVSQEITNASIILCDGTEISHGDMLEQKFTLQSVAKLVILIGLLEELGPKKILSIMRVEPSGDDFASVARLDQFGPKPSNPMLNSGAILLCDYLAGTPEERLLWLETWMEKLFGSKLLIEQKVFASERRTGDRNRALAYLLKSNKLIKGDIDLVLETYFYLCSFEATITQVAYLPMLLANHGISPEGEQVFSQETAQIVTSIMATCGLYNESGTHLVKTGMPSKSSVSGMIASVALGHGGIAVISPRVNAKGTSLRGSIILEHIANTLGWHFASK